MGRVGLARRVTVLALMLASQAAMAPPPPRPADGTVRLAGTQTFNMTDDATGREYRIFLSVPEGQAPEGGWPAITLIDGNFTFPIAWGQLRAGIAGGEAGPAVLIGVGYPTDDLSTLTTARNRDLTPSLPAADLPLPAGAPPPRPEDYGGADAFIRFLTGPLLSEVQSRVAVRRDKLALFGHSLGGLLATRVLLTRPDAYHTYLISSPFLSFADKAVLQDLPQLKGRIDSSRAKPRIFLSVGALEQRVPEGPPPPGLTAELIERLVARAALVDNVRALAAALAPLTDAGLIELEATEFAGERHSSVISSAISRGMAFAGSIDQR